MEKNVISVTRLRQDLYRLLDEVVEKGIPLRVMRKGEILKIIPPKKKNKLENLKPHHAIIGDPEKLIDIDWFEYWREKENL